MTSEDAIPESVLAETVVDVNLVPGALRDQLGDGATLVVFLRQLGCIFCREMVGKLRAASADFPPVLFFFQGTSTEGRVFLSRLWPEARAAGFEQGERLGDVFMMPGVFWVEGDRVRWAHLFRHAGDTPDFACIPELVGA